MNDNLPVWVDAATRLPPDGRIRPCVIETLFGREVVEARLEVELVAKKGRRAIG